MPSLPCRGSYLQFCSLYKDGEHVKEDTVHLNRQVEQNLMQERTRESNENIKLQKLQRRNMPTAGISVYTESVVHCSD